MATGKRVSGRPGTSHINLGDWASANRAGSQRLADELAGSVATAGQTAQAGMDALGDKFTTDVFNGTQFYDGLDGVNANHAEWLGDRGYQGPDTLSEMEGYDAAMTGADKAAKGAKQVGDLYGRATALQDTYGKKGDYTSGQRLLDSALAGNAGGSRFQQLGQQWGGLFDKAQGQERAASESAREARATSEATRARYAADAPILRAEEGRQSNVTLGNYMEGVEREQDQNEQRGGEAGAEPENSNRRRGRNYGAVSDWGGKGSWA